MTYAAYAKTEDGKEVEVCTMEADSKEQAQKRMAYFLWAADMEDAEVRLQD